MISASPALLSPASMQACMARCNSMKQDSTKDVANDTVATIQPEISEEKPKISLLSSEMSNILRTLRLPAQKEATIPAPVQAWLNKSVQGNEAKQIMETIYSDPKGDGRKLIEAMAASGVTVDTGAIEEKNVKGLYTPGNNHVRIQSGLDPETAVLVGIHEGLHGVITPEDGSKEEEGLNTVIATTMSARIFGKQSAETPEAIFQKMIEAYPDLPDTGSYAKPLADLGIRLQDYWPQKVT